MMAAILLGQAAIVRATLGGPRSWCDSNRGAPRACFSSAMIRQDSSSLRGDSSAGFACDQLIAVAS
jgi:hypothetical protein